MKKDDKASVSLKKILILSVLVIFSFSVIVFASNSKIHTIQIEYKDGETIQVLTTKTVVSEILEENHIILLPEEHIYPNLDSEMGETKTILISKEEIKEQEVATIEETKGMEQLLQDYAPIVEKIVVVQEEIPFETVTKDASGGSSSVRNSIITKGENGIREVTYRIKYQNEVEIEKTEISSTIIKEPVTQVVQVQTVSRGTSRSSVVTYGNGKWSYSASDLDLLCAITAQECSSSYDGALAVITTACNRTVSSRWSYNGKDPLSQYKARGQFCYSIDSHWKKRLNGNYPSYVKQAVMDALNGKRNHSYLSFRSAGTASGENIGGNVYFNHM